MKKLAPHIKEIRKSLRTLYKAVNESKGNDRIHRRNSFNKNFSVVLSSLEDVFIFTERLDSNISKSIEIESVIQQRNKREDKEKITEEGQRLRKIADKLTRTNQTDFKALYIFLKILLDKYTKLFYFILPWRNVSSRSVTAFFHSLKKYKGKNPLAITFIKKYLKKLKAVDFFLTSYRDKFVVHAEFKNISGTWFINEMNGKVRFIHPNRPSVTPQELLFVAKNYIVLSSKFIIDNWLQISKTVK